MKKNLFITALLTTAIIFSGINTNGIFADEQNDTGYYYGDVNISKSVDAADALIVLKHAAMLETITDGLPLVLADIKHDNTINASDALEILKVAAGLSDSVLYVPDEKTSDTENPDVTDPTTTNPAVTDPDVTEPTATDPAETEPTKPDKPVVSDTPTDVPNPVETPKIDETEVPNTTPEPNHSYLETVCIAGNHSHTGCYRDSKPHGNTYAEADQYTDTQTDRNADTEAD